MRDGRRNLRRVAASGVVMVAFVVGGFFVNTAIRMPCYDVCGSDIARLYEDRGIDRAHAPYVSRPLEYPPFIGAVMYAAAVPFAHGLRGPFLVNMLVLVSLAAVTTWVLWRRDGTRAWRWALAPPLLLQGLQNWDLLSVSTATIGLVQWERGAAFSAGVLLGAGAAAKLYPALFVPILLAAAVSRRAWTAAARVALGAAVGFAVFVVPVWLRAPEALRFVLRFHADRGPDRGSLWYFVFRTPAMHTWASDDTIRRFVTTVPSIVLVGVVAALVVAVARSRLSPVAACALATIACLLTSKIYSPQYDLWIVPFLVLLPVRRRLVVHFYVASFLVFAFTATEEHVLHRPASLYVLLAAVAYRFVVLACVGVDIVRSNRPTTPVPDRVIDLRNEDATATTAPVGT